MEVPQVQIVTMSSTGLLLDINTVYYRLYTKKKSAPAVSVSKRIADLQLKLHLYIIFKGAICKNLR